MFSNLKMSLAPLILRLGLAAILLYHGFLEISYRGDRKGWVVDLPSWLQEVVAWGNVVAGLLLVGGLLSRLAGLWGTITQIGAILIVTGKQDFVTVGNLVGSKPPPYRWLVGYEFNFALIVMSCALIVLGSGKWSIDSLLFRGRKGGPAVPASAGATPAGERVLAAVPSGAPSGITGQL